MDSSSILHWKSPPLYNGLKERLVCPFFKEDSVLENVPEFQMFTQVNMKSQKLFPFVKVIGSHGDVPMQRESLPCWLHPPPPPPTHKNKKQWRLYYWIKASFHWTALLLRFKILAKAPWIVAGAATAQ